MQKKCKENCCICYNIKLDELIYGAKDTLDKLSVDRVKKIYFNYNCDKNVDEKIFLLTDYLWILEDERRKHNLGGESCLDCNELQCLAEKVRKLTYSCDLAGRRDVQVDTSGVEQWIAKSGACVSRERWEKLVYEVFCDLNLEIEIDPIKCELDFKLMSIEQACDLAFEISSELLNCDLLFAIYAYKENCNLGFTVARTEQECEIDFKLLLEKVDCNLDFKTYKKLVDCNLSFDIIKTIYENGCTVEITENGPVLQTAIGSYPFETFNYSDKPDIEALKRLGINISNTEYGKNPDLFLKKLNSDYK